MQIYGMLDFCEECQVSYNTMRKHVDKLPLRRDLSGRRYFLEEDVLTYFGMEKDNDTNI
jgi:predicted site-specific integrase-resolvase